MSGEPSAPRPFTPEQIRDAMPPGTVREHVIEREGVVIGRRRWVVTAADPERAELEFEDLDADGLTTNVERRSPTWKELCAHATFPEARTRIDDVTLELPFGRLACRLYRVTDEDGETERRFWFAPEVPGAPVRFATVRGDVILHQSTLTARYHR